MLGVSNPDCNHDELLNQIHITGNPLLRNNMRTYIQTVFHHNIWNELCYQTLTCNQMALLVLSPASAFKDCWRCCKYPNHRSWAMQYRVSHCTHWVFKLLCLPTYYAFIIINRHCNPYTSYSNQHWLTMCHSLCIVRALETILSNRLYWVAEPDLRIEALRRIRPHLRPAHWIS